LFCFFCGCGPEESDTFKELPLAARTPNNNGKVERVKERLACEVCESTWEKRFVRGMKLARGVAEMGDLERLAWVTEVVIRKGLEERKRRVYG